MGAGAYVSFRSKKKGGAEVHWWTVTSPAGIELARSGEFHSYGKAVSSAGQVAQALVGRLCNHG